MLSNNLTKLQVVNYVTLLAQFTYPVGLSWCLRFLNLLLSEQVEMVTMVILGM